MASILYTMNPHSIRPIVDTNQRPHPPSLLHQIMEYFHSNTAIFCLRLVVGGIMCTLAVSFLLTYLNPTGIQFNPLLNQSAYNYLVASYLCFAATFLFWWGFEGIWWVFRRIQRCCRQRWGRRVQIDESQNQSIDV